VSRCRRRRRLQAAAVAKTRDSLEELLTLDEPESEAVPAAAEPDYMDAATPLVVSAWEALLDNDVCREMRKADEVWRQGYGPQSADVSLLKTSAAEADFVMDAGPSTRLPLDLTTTSRRRLSPQQQPRQLVSTVNQPQPAHFRRSMGRGSASSTSRPLAPGSPFSLSRWSDSVSSCVITLKQHQQQQQQKNRITHMHSNLC
jgi:hypothetical protein